MSPGQSASPGFVAENSTDRQQRRLDVAAVAILVASALLVFLPEVLLNQKLMDEDIFQQSIPALAWLRESLRTGTVSPWCSGILGGFPLSLSQYSFMFPLDALVVYLTDPDRAFAILLALHLPMAGVATYCYCREMGMSRVAGLLAGLGYQLSTEALALGINGYLLRSLFLLPTLLLATELVTRRGMRWGWLGAVAVGFAWYSGTSFINTIALINAAVYVLARSLALLNDLGNWRQSVRVAATMLASVAIGAGLAGARILPAMSVTEESVRSLGMSPAIASERAPDLALIATGYIVPLTRAFGITNGDPPSYVGPFILVVAVAGACCGWRLGWVRLMLAALFLNLLASLGESGGLFPLLRHLPTFEFYRSPSRFSVASALFLCLLAAYGLDSCSTWKVRATSAISKALLGMAVVALIASVLAIVVGWLWIYGGESGAGLRAIAEARHLGPVNPLRPRIAAALLAIPASVCAVWMMSVGRMSITGRCIPAIAALV